jgi:tetratricopeptide (TPR) repeat protein
MANALNHLKKVIKINPNSPVDIWLGIGIIYFKMNNFIKAKFSLEHVIHLEPKNSMALTALGITEIQLNSSNLE